jgi:hypothetical protein
LPYNLRTAVASKLSCPEPDLADKETRLAFYHGLQGPAEWLSDVEFASLIASTGGLGDDVSVLQLQVLHLYQGLLPPFAEMCLWHESKVGRAQRTMTEEIANSVTAFYKKCDGVRGQVDPFDEPQDHTEAHITILDDCVKTKIHMLVKYGTTIADQICIAWVTDMSELAKVIESWIPLEYILHRETLSDHHEVHALHPLHTGGRDYNGKVLPCIRPPCPYNTGPHTYPHGHEFVPTL